MPSSTSRPLPSSSSTSEVAKGSWRPRRSLPTTTIIPHPATSKVVPPNAGLHEGSATLTGNSPVPVKVHLHLKSAILHALLHTSFTQRPLPLRTSSVHS
ncbi:hypothetical protein HPP92_028948 [Vanilla planifolia]|uniref:Uncharacterized protein n=1 Tax=Vanilla planifolia TaxID=51239 RepID=A0A835U1R0_VANPL|nr:hypothetical protein HPP92_028938 [Vanilla planifolia]KAG0446245.1 hypothetical protein HPP92_028948 [Vanilla planifolia]